MKAAKLLRVCTDFAVLNGRLVKSNHVFPLVSDCTQTIGQGHCKVMGIPDLRNAEHTLRLAPDSQKYSGIMPLNSSPRYF